MDWKDVAKVIAPLAPTVGGILGGLIPFPGGAMIGQALGNIIARQFGVPATPDAVNEAILKSGNDLAIAKLQAANEQAKNEIAGYARVEEAYAKTLQTGLEQTGLTMRAELEHQSLYFTGWRSGAGWTFTIHAFLFGFVLLYAAFCDAVLLDRLSSAWPIYAAFFGTLAAMVGVYIVGRTQERIAGVIPPPPSKPAVKPK